MYEAIVYIFGIGAIVGNALMSVGLIMVASNAINAAARSRG